MRPRFSPITSRRRITAIATLAALIRRERTGTGAHVHISQAEVAVNQLAVAYVAEAAAQAGLPLTEDPAVHAVCPCAGKTNGASSRCATGPTATRWRALIGIDLPADGAALTAILGAYTGSRDKHVITEELQARRHPGRADEPAGRCARRRAVAVPFALRRSGASALRRADAQ